jgi:hypothetical protein
LNPLRILAAAACLLGADAVHAQMYKCVDAQGVTGYSDKACPGGKGKEEDIRGQPPISGKIEADGTDPAAAERGFRNRQQQRDREQQKEAAAADARKRRCAQLQAEHQRWLSVNRVTVADSKGERRYMDDAERQAKIAQLEAGIARDCQ